MFWTNWNEQRPSIMRSTLSGNNIKVVISTDVFTPNGLTIDNKAEKLYFSDGSLGKIERCEYDGSNRHVSTPTLLFFTLSKTDFCCCCFNCKIEIVNLLIVAGQKIH